MKRIVIYVEAEHDGTAVTLENEKGEELLPMPKVGACAVYWTDDPDYDVNKELGFFDHGTLIKELKCSDDDGSSSYKIIDRHRLSKWVLEPFEIEGEFGSDKLVFPVRAVNGWKVLVIDRVTYDGKLLKIANWIAHG